MSDLLGEVVPTSGNPDRRGVKPRAASLHLVKPKHTDLNMGGERVPERISLSLSALNGLNGCLSPDLNSIKN